MMFGDQINRQTSLRPNSHECSYLFYLADIVILFVGIPQTLTPLFRLVAPALG